MRNEVELHDDYLNILGEPTLEKDFYDIDSVEKDQFNQGGVFRDVLWMMQPQITLEYKHHIR